MFLQMSKLLCNVLKILPPPHLVARLVVSCTWFYIEFLQSTSSNTCFCKHGVVELSACNTSCSLAFYRCQWSNIRQLSLSMFSFVARLCWHSYCRQQELVTNPAVLVESAISVEMYRLVTDGWIQYITKTCANLFILLNASAVASIKRLTISDTSKVRKCAVSPDNLRSAISFSRTLILHISHSLFNDWNASLVVSAWLRNCMRLVRNKRYLLSVQFS